MAILNIMSSTSAIAEFGAFFFFKFFLRRGSYRTRPPFDFCCISKFDFKTERESRTDVIFADELKLPSVLFWYLLAEQQSKSKHPFFIQDETVLIKNWSYGFEELEYFVLVFSFYASSKVLHNKLQLTRFLVKIYIDKDIAIRLRVLYRIHHDVECHLLEPKTVSNHVRRQILILGAFLRNFIH